MRASTAWRGTRSSSRRRRGHGRWPTCAWGTTSTARARVATSTTEVLAHWRTRKPGYRVTLEDGTKILASGDHRFLSRHGWGYVASEDGAIGRPAGHGAARPASGSTRPAPAPARPRPSGEAISCGRRPAVLAIGSGSAASGSSPRARPRTPTTGAATCAGRPWGRPPLRLTPAAGGAGARGPVPGALGLSMTAAAVAGYREVRVARPTAESLRHVHHVAVGCR